MSRNGPLFMSDTCGVLGTKVFAVFFILKFALKHVS